MSLNEKYKEKPSSFRVKSNKKHIKDKEDRNISKKEINKYIER